MASSSFQEKVVETVVIQEEGVTLNLSYEEAKTLLIILCRVGGSPTQTRRGDADAVWNELKKYVHLGNNWHVSAARQGRDRIHGHLELADDDGLFARDRL